MPIQQWIEELEAGHIETVIAELKAERDRYEEYMEAQAQAEEAWAVRGDELIRDLCGEPEEVPF